MVVLVDEYLVVISFDDRHADAAIPRNIRVGVSFAAYGEHGLFQYFRRSSPNLYSRKSGVELPAAGLIQIFVAPHP